MKKYAVWVGGVFLGAYAAECETAARLQARLDMRAGAEIDGDQRMTAHTVTDEEFNELAEWAYRGCNPHENPLVTDRGEF
jgi:hypothetical protein